MGAPQGQLLVPVLINFAFHLTKSICQQVYKDKVGENVAP
jgi:hypothetical protein